MKNSRKISMLIVFHDTIFNSGGTRSLLDLVDRLLIDPSMELICLFPRPTGTAIDYLREKNIKIIICRYWYCTGPITASYIEKQKRKLKFILGWINIQKLIHQRLRSCKIDIVYSNTGVIYAGAWISRALQLPHIWHIREFLEEDHGIEPLMGWKKYYKFVNQNITVAVMISEALKKKHRKGIDRDKIRVIHDDLSPSYLVFPEKPWIIRKWNLLFAGTICEGKGQLVAIKALAVLRKRELFPKLLIAGTVKERDQYYYNILQEAIIKNKLENQVEFLGQVDNLAEVRKKCGIGIVASQSEAFGRVTIEGMLADMLMIGADAGGTSELIFDGKNGYLFSLDNSEKLAGILEFVLTVQPDEIDSVRTEGLRSAQEYICGKCADKLKQIIIDNVK